MASPCEIYQAARARCVHAGALAQQRSDRLARGRLVGFAAIAAAVWAAWAGHLAAVWSSVPIMAFLGLVVLHERAHRQMDRAARGVAHHDDGLARIAGTWAGRGNARTDLVAADHPYARDLDLFGAGSIFEMLCTARTAAGERTLAAWLLAPSDPATLMRRRAAVIELTPNVALREDLAGVGAAVRAEVDPEALSRWGEAPARLDPSARRRIAALSWALPPCVIATWSLWVLEVLPLWPAIVATAATAGVHRLAHGFTALTAAAIERPARELAVVAELIARLEAEAVSAPSLVALQAALVRGDHAASARIGALRRRFEWMQLQRSQLFAIVAWLLCWPEHFALAIERWRLRHGAEIRRWFAALGELEALGALAARAFEQPDDVWPEFIDDGPCVIGTALGHPLLSREVGVTNDVDLGGTTRALMISGSNMAGKSTYMRTVGVNVALALAGAPVRAGSLRLSRVQIGASIRIEDSLRDGASRFYAEISRLRQIVELGESPTPVLFLLDEVLHGTNSHDRRVGARAVLQRLLDAGAIGMMTTHDLALATDVEPDAPRVRNVHFCDTLDGERLVFDYRVREGIVQTSNALALMRAVGLHV